MDELAAYAVRGLSKRYRGTTSPANAGIDLTVPAGEVFGLLGPNGAGKTTLVRQLAGLVRPDTGSISLFGHDMVAEPTLAARLMGYLAQDEPALAELPVRLAVETTARLRGVPGAAARRRAGDVIDELALTPLANQPLVRLSGGQRRLACLASALAGDRPVLILDEPTTGLDPVARRAVWTALRRRRDEQGTTIVLVTHNVLEAESVLDRVAVLDRGRIIACDTPSRLTASVDDAVRIGLVWRQDPPRGNPAVAAIEAAAAVEGRRWTIRVSRDRAQLMLGALMTSGVLESLDDVTVTAPSLEDVYLTMGGLAADLERA